MSYTDEELLDAVREAIDEERHLARQLKEIISKGKRHRFCELIITILGKFLGMSFSYDELKYFCDGAAGEEIKKWFGFD